MAIHDVASEECRDKATRYALDTAKLLLELGAFRLMLEYLLYVEQATIQNKAHGRQISDLIVGALSVKDGASHCAMDVDTTITASSVFPLSDSDLSVMDGFKALHGRVVERLLKQGEVMQTERAAYAVHVPCNQMMGVSCCVS